jgi:NDP-sugar pyrophosphorylase family protein
MKTMINPTLLILAAGGGNRYGGLKPAQPVGPGCESIVDYSIYDARRAGFDKIVVVIRREVEQQIRERIAQRFEKHIVFKLVFQDVADLPGFPVPAGRTRQWGSTHAILAAAGEIHEPFAVINLDDFYGAESFRAMAHHLQSGSTDYATVGFALRSTLSDFGAVARGVCQVDSNGYLENILELRNIEREKAHAVNIDSEGRETRLTGDEIVSMNMWGFTPQVFPQLREHFQTFLQLNGKDLDAECYIPNTVNELLKAGQARVKVLRRGESWFGITYEEDHPVAVENMRHMIEAGYYPRRLWK